MNRECPIVEDLLPLYLEGLVSPETGEMVREHLQTCPSCQKRKMQMAQSLPEKAPEAPMHRVQKLLEKRKMRLLLLTALVALLTATAIFAWISAPNYLSVKDAAPKVVQTENEVYIAFSTNSHHTDCYRTVNAETGAIEYTLEAWYTALDGSREPCGLQCICIPKTEEMTIWYTQHNGQADICLYGKTEDTCYTLPRLALQGYVILAAVMAAISGLAALLCRKVDAKRKLCSVFIIPVSFLGGAMLVKGFDLTSYNLSRDLAMIGMVSLVLMAMLHLLLQHFRRKRRKAPDAD